MALDCERLQKPFTKLGKLLKKLPKQPSPDEVHDIRTRTRRVEAALHAVSLDRKRKGQRAVDSITPVRKQAGKVRDMDVLIAFASGLSAERDPDCHVQLLEYLGHERFQQARKLHKAVLRQRSAANRSLKRCASSIERSLDGSKARTEWATDAAAAALSLSGELANWPKLNANNLHPFRLKVKELRYTLQFSGKESELVEKLGEVKDAIGEWHDWTELANTAQEALDHPGHCDVQEQIRAGAKERFDKALALANHLRSQYFDRPRTKNRSKRGAGSIRVKEPVLKASARLAA